MKAQLLAFAAAAVFAACNSSKNLSAPDTKLVELRTSGCRGFCPIYRLTFWNNGKAEFEGIKFTAQAGLRNFVLDKTELADLQALVADANLWQYPDRIESTVADAPSATLTAFGDNGKTKSVTGSIDRPKPLLELEARLKRLAEKNGLQVQRGVDANQPAPGYQRELIVQLKDDVNAGNWLRQFQELRLQLVKRIPPNNTWVVAYDTRDVSEKSVLELFRSMEGCISAQPNTLGKE